MSRLGLGPNTLSKRNMVSFAKNLLYVPTRFLATASIALLAILPVFQPNPYVVGILIDASIAAIFVASWDILGGYAGQVSFGHALFFGVAAYTSGILNTRFAFPPWMSIPIAVIVAISVGLLVGIPCLRLKGPFLALATLAFPIILSGLFAATQLSPITGGEYGIRGINRLIPSIDRYTDRIIDYYMGLGVMLISTLILFTIGNSRLGTIFRAVREDETAAEASGISTTKYKLIAFVLSGLFAGLSGCLFAHYRGVVSPAATLSVDRSFSAIVFSVFGGIGTIVGGVGGAYIITILLEVLRITQELRLLLYSFVVVGVILLLPEGVITRIRIELTKAYTKIIERRYGASL